MKYGDFNVKDLQDCDVLHCRSNGFIARAIQWFTKSRLNHTALILNIRDEFFVIDSQIDGTNMRPLDEWLKKYNYIYKITRPWFNWNKEDIKTRALSMIGHSPYDILSLIWYQPIYQLFGKWKGKRSPEAKERLYCSEFVAWVFNMEIWWKASPEFVFKRMKERNDFVFVSSEFVKIN